MNVAGHKIVVGVDGAEPGRAAARWAARFAGERGLGPAASAIGARSPSNGCRQGRGPPPGRLPVQRGQDWS
jgi:nucleotide-binding universal stress UspA family protein